MASLMPQGKQRYTDNNGNNLSGGKVYTYSAGTSTPLATYSDAAGTTPNANPVVLNARGEATIFWGASPYKVVMKDASDVEIWTQDNLQASTGVADLASTASGKGASLVGVQDASDYYAASTVEAVLAEVGDLFETKSNRVVNSITALRALDKTRVTRAFVTGYSAAGDGGGGAYWYDSADTATADNGGTVIVANDGGRWKLAESGTISARQFGAKGDGATDDATALQAYATWALSVGKPFRLPAGAYLSSAKISGSGKPVAIQGDGLNASRLIFTTVTGGIEFVLNAQSAGVPPQAASIYGITIESRAAVSSPALSLEWSAYQPNAEGSFYASDFHIVRKDDGTGSFTAGIKLNKCIVGFMSRFVILGDDARVSQYGVHLVDCVGIRLSDFDINRYQEGVQINKVSATQSEGVLITNGFIYDVNRGLNSPDQAIHINLLNSHININGTSAVACATLTNASQSNIEGCLLYFGGNPGDAVNQDCIQIAQRSGNKVSGNFIVGITKVNTRNGVLTLGSTSYNSIVSNQISNSTTGIFVSAAGDTGNRILNNEFFGCTTNIADSGTSTYKVGNTDSGVPISHVRWGVSTGTLAVGQLGADANWGGFIWPHNGSVADLALADSAGTAVAGTETGRFGVRGYAKASLPSASAFGGSLYGLIVVTDDIGGLTLAFSDGAAWRRVADRAVIS